MKIHTITQRQEFGFTLLEVLVVMILTGLVSTILFEGLAQAVRIRQNAGIESTQLQRDAMRLAWYRQLVNGLVPDLPNGAARFQGGLTSFRGLSLNPVSIDSGALAPVSVTLSVDVATRATALRVASDEYAGTTKSVTLLHLVGTDFAFAYLDDDGNRNSVWPPQTLGTRPQLPAAIWIVTTQNGARAELLTATVIGARDALPRLPTIVTNSGVVP